MSSEGAGGNNLNCRTEFVKPAFNEQSFLQTCPQFCDAVQESFRCGCGKGNLKILVLWIRDLTFRAFAPRAGSRAAARSSAVRLAWCASPWGVCAPVPARYPRRVGRAEHRRERPQLQGSIHRLAAPSLRPLRALHCTRRSESLVSPRGFRRDAFRAGPLPHASRESPCKECGKFMCSRSLRAF